jgi:DNA-binding NarL/FixJ family response regulator
MLRTVSEVRSSGANGARRPTVVVADDHVRVLQSVSSMLAADFDVLATVADGRQALEAVKRFDPDALVLDITMPVLDGFRTARELARLECRTRVVFLTMHQGEEYVAAAMGAGAAGYVLKTRIHADLSSALRHTLDGRLFAPSLASVSTVAQRLGTGAHVVQFGANGHTVLNEVGDHLAAALRRGDLTVVVMAPAARQGIEERLLALGNDLAAATVDGRYLSLDAAESAFQITRGGRIDPDLLEGMVNDLERRRVAAGAQRVALFGEMATLLLQSGNVQAALQLEQLWGELTRKLPFLTICSYPTQSFGPAAPAGIFERLCAAHAAVCHA